MGFMVLVSLWATYDLQVSLSKVAGVLLGLAVFFAFSIYGRTARGWLACFLIFMLTGLGVALLGLFGTHWFTTKLTVLNIITQRLPALVSGLQGAEGGFHPNQVAGSLLWVIPPFFALVLAMWQNRNFFTGKERHAWHSAKVLVLLLAGFILLVFVLTQSRSAYLGLVASVAFVFFFSLRGGWRWAYFGVMLILFTAGGFLLSHVSVDVLFGEGNGLASALQPAFSLNTLDARVEIWSRAIYGIQDFPFTGMGINTFRYVVWVLYPLFSISPEFNLGHAHNEFLQVALDLGIPGLIAFVSLYLVALRLLIETWRAALGFSFANSKRWLAWLNGRAMRLLVLGLGGGLLAHLFYGLTDAVALGAKTGVLFWMLIGLVSGLHQWQDASS